MSAENEARRREARRAFVRRAHPDVGGDPEVFRLGLAAIDAEADAERRAERGPVPSADGGGPRLRDAALRQAGRLARDWSRLPREISRAYRSGRDAPDLSEDSPAPES